MIRRREFLVGAGAATIAAPTIVRAQQPTVIKMGALKLIHSIAPYFYQRFTPAGYEVEVIPFESPADGKNAVAGALAVTAGPRDIWLHFGDATIADGKPVRAIENLVTGETRLLEWGGVRLQIDPAHDPALLFRCHT